LVPGGLGGGRALVKCPWYEAKVSPPGPAAHGGHVRATVLVPLLTGLNPPVALFTAGLGTLVFHLVTGQMVPLFLGSSFAFIAPILAAKEAGFSLSAIGGGLVAAGLVYGLFALLVLLIGSQRVRWVFPPVVTGPVIVVIGLTLAPVVVQMASKDWLLAIVTFASAVVSAVFFRGLFQMIPVLLGVGRATSWPSSWAGWT
jgi:Xanthine/uracil permeases